MIFKQVFRIAFITVIWKQYKAWIVSTTLLLLSFYLIGQIHSDLLQYWELQKDNDKTASSIIYKWLAYLVSVFVYCFYHYFRPKKPNANSRKFDKKKRKQLEQELVNLPEDEDPFRDIRNRDKLRTQSDFILNKPTNSPKKGKKH